MMDLYSFSFRGQLAEQALDAAGRTHPNTQGFQEAEIAVEAGLPIIDEKYVNAARPMAAVYVAIAAFENSVREFVKDILLDAYGDKWWDDHVKSEIQNRATRRRDDESKNRWHGARGGHLIEYTDISDLASIIRGNYVHFEDFCVNPEWVTGIFTVVEKSRNVIMHSGTLGRRDVQRLGQNIRDWIVQVGA